MTKEEIEKRLEILWNMLNNQLGPICRKYSDYPNASILVFAKLSEATTLMLKDESLPTYGMGYCWNCDIYKMPNDCPYVAKMVQYSMAVYKKPVDPNIDVAHHKFPLTLDNSVPYGKAKICAWDMINHKYLEF